jgi:hypothetical protein
MVADQPSNYHDGDHHVNGAVGGADRADISPQTAYSKVIAGGAGVMGIDQRPWHCRCMSVAQSPEDQAVG